MDVLELSSRMEHAKMHDGRLKAAFEDMSNRAVRPDMELMALARDVSSDRKLGDYLSFRKALIVADLAATDAGSTIGSASATAPSKSIDNTEAGSTESILSLDIFNQTPTHATVLPPAAVDVEIPFILDAPRCEIGANGCQMLSKLMLQSKALMKRIVYLDLSHNTLTDTGTMYTNFSDLCDAMTGLVSLRFLSLAGNALSGPGADGVARILRQNPSVTHLDLSDCSLGLAGAEELLPAFKRALPLDESEPSDTPLALPGVAGEEEEEMDPVVLEILRQAQAERDAEQGKKKKHGPSPTSASVGSVNNSLLWLDLSGNNLHANGLDPKPAAQLVRAILAHPAIQHLNLSRSRLGDARVTAAALVTGVSKNRTLRSLALDDNGLDAAPAAQMAAALEENGTLTHLYLRGNRVRSDGASAFAALIRRRTLPVRAGQVEDSQEAAQGTSQAASAVPGPSLAYLDLRDNYIGPIGRHDLALALEGLPAPPEVTRGRVAGQMEEGDEFGQQGEQEEGEAYDDRVDPGSVALSSRPSTAATSTGMEGGPDDAFSAEEMGARSASRASHAADPSAVARGGTPASGMAASALDVPNSLAEDSVESVGADGAGGRSPNKRIAGSGIQAVLALRTEGEGQGSGEEDAAEQGDKPLLPKSYTLPDGSVANQFGHRVLL